MHLTGQPIKNTSNLRLSPVSRCSSPELLKYRCLKTATCMVLYCITHTGRLPLSLMSTKKQQAVWWPADTLIVLLLVSCHRSPLHSLLLVPAAFLLAKETAAALAQSQPSRRRTELCHSTSQPMWQSELGKFRRSVCLVQPQEATKLYLVHLGSTLIEWLCLLPIGFDTHREERWITVLVGLFHELVSVSCCHPVKSLQELIRRTACKDRIGLRGAASIS